MGEKVRPPLVDFQTPPEAAPTYNTSGLASIPAMAATRPLIPDGPMARARIPASRSGSTAAAKSAAGSARKNSETTSKGTDFRSMQTSNSRSTGFQDQGFAVRGEWLS